MNSDRVGTWLSIIANFGVVIGLILLVLEIRHSTMATEATLYQEDINYGRDQIELLLADENKQLAELIFRAEVEPDSLLFIEDNEALSFVYLNWLLLPNVPIIFKKG